VADLLVLWHDINNFGHDDLEVIGEKLINLIKNQHLAVIQFGDVFRG